MTQQVIKTSVNTIAQQVVVVPIGSMGTFGPTTYLDQSKKIIYTGVFASPIR